MCLSPTAGQRLSICIPPHIPLSSPHHLQIAPRCNPPPHDLAASPGTRDMLSSASAVASSAKVILKAPFTPPLNVRVGPRRLHLMTHSIARSMAGGASGCPSRLSVMAFAKPSFPLHLALHLALPQLPLRYHRMLPKRVASMAHAGHSLAQPWVSCRGAGRYVAGRAWQGRVPPSGLASSSEATCLPGNTGGWVLWMTSGLPRTSLSHHPALWASPRTARSPLSRPPCRLSPF